jgi:hypothetical protein
MDRRTSRLAMLAGLTLIVGNVVVAWLIAG